MLSPAEIAKIKDDIAKLEKFLESCTDSGIREQIEYWIELQRKKLTEK